MIKAALVILALAFSSSAFGMVYSWTDSSGTKHFSNKRDEIPERYRSKAKPLYPEQVDMLPGQQGTQSQPVKPEAAPPASTAVPPTAPPAVQQVIPTEPLKTQQPAAAPAPPLKEGVPSAGRKERRRPRREREE